LTPRTGFHDEEQTMSGSTAYADPLSAGRD
jgi:hypothetical protein